MSILEVQGLLSQVISEIHRGERCMVDARHNTDFSHRRSDSYVEDKNRGCNAAGAMQLSPLPTVDPPVVIIIKPPLRRVSLPDRFG